jgi:hypothetical protein
MLPGTANARFEIVGANTENLFASYATLASTKKHFRAVAGKRSAFIWDSKDNISYWPKDQSVAGKIGRWERIEN